MEKYEGYTWHNKLKREYGWTRRLILLFFPTPDFYVDHHIPEFRPYHMISDQKIKEIMEMDEFKREKARSDRYAAGHKYRDKSTYPGRYGYPKNRSKEFQLNEIIL